VVALSATALSACGSSGSKATPPATSAKPTTAITASPTAEPAGVNPSESAKMVCSAEAQKDVAVNLGVKATSVTTPTWVDHLYSCSYVYPDGTMTFSVKELNNLAETTEYFNALGKTLGRTPGPASLQGTAFYTNDGSLVLRKDFKVMHVDLAQIPEKFGKPPGNHQNIGLRAGFAILSCWTGE
jgi:hypothetical protein